MHKLLAKEMVAHFFKLSGKFDEIEILVSKIEITYFLPMVQKTRGR